MSPAQAPNADVTYRNIAGTASGSGGLSRRDDAVDWMVLYVRVAFVTMLIFNIYGKSEESHSRWRDMVVDNLQAEQQVDTARKLKLSSHGTECTRSSPTTIVPCIHMPNYTGKFYTICWLSEKRFSANG